MELPIIDRFGNIPHWLLLTSGCILSWAMIVMFYRLKLHPLAKYPGPWLGRLTDWYSVYHSWKGDRHLDFHYLHQTHGNIVRFGPNRISVCTNSGLKTLYGFNANVRKSDWYLVFGLAFDVENVFSMLHKAIQMLQPHIIRNVKKLCGHLRNSSVSGCWSDPKDMSKWIGYVTLDIICDLCFNRNWNLMGSEQYQDLLQTFEDGSGAINIAGYMPWILKLKSDWSFLRHYIRGARRFNEVTKDITNARLNDEKDGQKQDDVIAVLLKANDPETGQFLTRPELGSETGLLVTAGSDTSRVAIASTIFYCLHYPQTLERLQAEIRGTFNDADEIEVGPKLQSCRFLRACIDEAMRLSPSFGGLLARQVLPGGICVDDLFFPAGTEIGTPVYALHHDERYHPDAFTFKPTRWMIGEDVSTMDVAREQSAFFPFGMGPRACAGKSLAYAEMTILLARIVSMFDMRISETAKTMHRYRLDARGASREKQFQVFDSVIAITDGPMVEFRERPCWE